MSNNSEIKESIYQNSESRMLSHKEVKKKTTVVNDQPFLQYYEENIRMKNKQQQLNNKIRELRSRLISHKIKSNLLIFLQSIKILCEIMISINFIYFYQKYRYSNLMQSQMTEKCFIRDCDHKIQAACFLCCEFYCFKHSMNHAQANKEHNLIQMDQSIKHISQQSKLNLKTIHSIKQLLGVQKRQYQNEEKLTPQKFQQQLDQLSFIKKQTIKIVEKFFTQISLQLVNIWQTYLKKYSGQQTAFQIYEDIANQLMRYVQPWKLKMSVPQIIRQYFNRNFSSEIANYQSKLKSKVSQEIPACPNLQISPQILVEISQLLCGSISTQNYQTSPSKQLINIQLSNYLQTETPYLSIFPIKKQYCYLYNLKEKQYQVQQFDKLKLPAYPKSIVLPNNDLHIIGGLSLENKPISTHLVFRCSTSEIYKLTDLPYCVNPVNALCFHSENIFLIGGMISESQWSEKCLKFDLKTKQWKKISSMDSVKVHQSCCTFNDLIFCFGMPETKKMNIERYLILKDKWEEIKVQNILSNPFNFAAGFSSLQINHHQILLFGGKKFLQAINNKKRITDKSVSSYIYTFRAENNSFKQIGALNSSNSVQYGQLNPFIHNGAIITAQFIVSKNNPIVRWFNNIEIIEIKSNGVMEAIQIIHEN